MYIFLPIVFGLAVVFGMWSYGYHYAGVTTANSQTGERTQQVVGQSGAGQSQNMPPAQAADQAKGQLGSSNDTGRRAQAITQTASPDVPLSPDQRQRIKSFFQKNAANRANNEFSIAIGAEVPQQLQSLPPEVVNTMQNFRGDEYIIVGDRMVIAEPKSRRVVAIVPM